MKTANDLPSVSKDPNNSDTNFLADFLSETQISALLQNYPLQTFGKLFREIALITGKHLTAELLHFCGNIAKTPKLNDPNIYEVLIPALLNFYQAEPITTIEDADKAFMAMSLKADTLTKKLMTLIDPLILLYHHQVLKNDPSDRQNCLVIFRFIKDSIDRDTDEHVIMHLSNALMEFFEKVKSYPEIQEITFLFEMSKIFMAADDFVELLILIRNSEANIIDMKMLIAWSIEFKERVPESYYYKSQGHELVIRFTKAILALHHMQQLDNEGRAIEKLKQLTFREQADPNGTVIAYLSVFFDKELFYPELGRYFLNPLPLFYYLDIENHVANFLIELVDCKFIPNSINFEEFIQAISELFTKNTHDSFYMNKKNQFSDVQSALLNAFNHSLFELNIEKPDSVKAKLFYAAIRIIKIPLVQYRSSIAEMLVLYLFGLYFNVPIQSDKIVAHFINYDREQLWKKFGNQFNILASSYHRSILSFTETQQILTVLFQLHIPDETFDKLIFLIRKLPKSDFKDLMKFADTKIHQFLGEIDNLQQTLQSRIIEKIDNLYQLQLMLANWDNFNDFSNNSTPRVASEADETRSTSPSPRP